MLPERLRDTSIVWRFAVTTFIVFGLIGVGIASLRASDLRTRSEEAAAVRAELIAESVIAPLLTSADLEGPIRGARYRELDRAVHRFAMEDAGVERVKVWSRDGTVVFSNDPEQVGLEPEPEEDLLEAFEGEVASEISDLSEPENASERLLADQLFETYVPVHLTDGDRSAEVDAVIEVYQDYSAIQREIDRLNDTLTISLGIGLLALYVLLLPVMVGTTRTLTARDRGEPRGQRAQVLGAGRARPGGGPGGRRLAGAPGARRGDGDRGRGSSAHLRPIHADRRVLHASPRRRGSGIAPRTRAHAAVRW
jgi:two-component system, NarL family, sensor kinase